MNSVGINCMVCDNQRAPGQIHRRESKVLKGAGLYICSICDRDKKEPRAFIIIVARTGDKGLASVRDYIIHRRYEGSPITAREITK